MVQTDPISQSRFNFAQQVADPTQWYYAASNLLASARILATEIEERWDLMNFWKNKSGEMEFKEDNLQPADFQTGYFMLVAFGIENILKGVFVMQNRAVIHSAAIEEGKLPNPLRTHDLVRLSQMCNAKLSDDQLKILRRLERFSQWIGRYHLPSDFIEYYNLKNGNTVPSNAIGFCSSDTSDIREFIIDLCNLLGVDPKAIGGGLTRHSPQKATGFRKQRSTS